MLRAFCHGWNRDRCSDNLLVEPDGLTLCPRKPFGCIYMAQAKIGYNYGVHVWEITWKAPISNNIISLYNIQHSLLQVCSVLFNSVNTDCRPIRNQTIV